MTNSFTEKIGKLAKNQHSILIQKIERHMQRDLEVNSYLESQNWKVLRFYSNDVKKT